MDRDKARNAFMAWCKMNKIPYKTFNKFDTQYKNWKSLATKKNTARKNFTGNGEKEGQPEEFQGPMTFECNYDFSYADYESVVLFFLLSVCRQIVFK